MIKRFFGVSIAVKDLDTAVKKYRDVFRVKPKFVKPEKFSYPGLKGAMFSVGGVRITLTASEKPDTPIAKFVETRGEGVFLLSFEVTDAAEATKELIGKGVNFVSDKPLSFPGGVTNFSHPKSMHGVQFEFLQPDPDSWLTE